MVKKILSLYLIVFLAFPSMAIADEPEEKPEYDVTSLKAGEPAPFDGVLLSIDAAAKIAIDKKFEDAECDLRISYELRLQSESFQLQLDFKDIEIHSWKDKYESMMILKVAENERLQELVLKQKPGTEPFMVALGFGIGTLTSLGIFAISTEIVKSE
tara:strand:+ start:3484 stop:3954 length:471 start_codon:yes stop_codon:yes gene_type:complete